VKTEDLVVAAGHSVDPARWQEAFEVLMGRIAGRFARVEPRRRVRDLVLGLLSDLPRKNCWSIAAWARHPSLDGLIPLTCNEIQRLFTMLVVQPVHDVAHRLRWSAWRRRHQARAQASHYRRQAANQT
jgi:hypothetical protein